MKYDGEMTSHYAAPIDGLGSPVYDPSSTGAGAGHHARISGNNLPLQPSASLPRSPTYSPHPSVGGGGGATSLASPYSAVASGGAGGAAGGAGYAAAAAAAVAMNSSSSAAAAAAVDSLLKRDKDAIYRQETLLCRLNTSHYVVSINYYFCTQSAFEISS